MAVYRQVHIEFWQDPFILNLTPEEKYFYLYIMTNSKTSQCGVYEISLKVMEMETGYNRETVEKLLKRFVEYDKIMHSEVSKNTIELLIVNWLKFNPINNANIEKCVLKEMKTIKTIEYLEFIIFKSLELGFRIEKIEGAYKGLIRGYQDPTKQKEEEKEKEKEKEEAEQEQAATIENLTTTDTKLIVKAYGQNIHPPSPIEIEKLSSYLKDLEVDVIIMAIEEAVLNNVRTLRYIQTILNSWVDKGFKTKEHVLAYKRDYEEKKKKGKEEKEGEGNPYAHYKDYTSSE